MMRYAVVGVSMLLAVRLTAQSLPAKGDVRFDVASVKPSAPLSRTNPTSDYVWQLTPTRFTARNVPLRDYLTWAFNTDRLRLVTPSSFQNQQFDIVATAPALSPDTLRPALRALLEERFSVKAHRETRDMNVDALVLANADGKLGPNLRRVSIDCTNPANTGACGFVGDGVPSFGYRGADWKTLDLAMVLSSHSKSGFIVDRTGLSGQFDLLLKYRSEDFKDATDPENVARPRFEDALREQLGLKLVPSREATEVVVIDSIERPTPD